MPHAINDTHDAKLTSWVESANDPASDFPIQNLPLGAFLVRHEGHTHHHLGVAIGDRVLDVTALAESGYFGTDKEDEFGEFARLPYWTPLGATPGMLSRLRRRLQYFLRSDAPAGQQMRRLRQKALRAAEEIPLVHPVGIFNYTDFYASVHHATNVGSMFRPDNPLLPNYKWVPIGYHGRASSIIVSPSEVRRPRGQTKADDAAAPSFGPSRMLDYELEVGCLIGPGNPLGRSIPMASAEDHILGFCLVNDWSARDLQKWEYQPLGPFLAKSFGTTISPWVLTAEALAPFRAAPAARPAGDPAPMPHLSSEENTASGALDITLEVMIRTAAMRERSMPAHRLSIGSLRDMYWTFAQMIAHHSSNGCNLRPGDLLASGTVSGPGRESRGCLLELTWDAPGKPRVPLALPSGETRLFLEDGDEVIMRGWCERDGYRRIGFGECRGIITPAIEE